MANKRKKKGQAVPAANGPHQPIEKRVYSNTKLLSSKIWADFKNPQDVPTMHRKLFDRIQSGRATPSEQVKYRCLICKNWVRGDIEQCRKTHCPVFGQAQHAKQLNRGIILSTMS